MHLRTIFISLRVLEQTSSPAASLISSQVPHAGLSRLRRNHHSASHSLNRSPVAVVALPRASMHPPSRAMQTPQSKVMKSSSSVIGGTIMGVSPMQSPGIGDHSMRGSKTRPNPLRLGTPYTDSGDGVYSSGAKMGGGGITGAYCTRAVGQLQRRRKKAECVVVTVREAGVVPLGAAIGL